MKTKITQVLKLLLITIIFAFANNQLANGQVVYDNDVDGIKIGNLTKNDMLNTFSIPVSGGFCNGCDEGRVFGKSVSGRGRVLGARYPKDGVKSSSSGMQTRIPLPQGYDELYLSYWVYFPANFEFRAGGKLPGLMCHTSNRNMTLRLMWRYNGLAEFYVHYNTQPQRPGYRSSINWSLTNPIDEPNGNPQPDQVKFKRGQWNHIEMYYKLNTPGMNNGIMKGWLDGDLAVDIRNNGDFRKPGEGDIKMNTIFISTFFGGTDVTFQPQKNEEAYFDDFKVSQSRIGYPGNNNGSGGGSNGNIFSIKKKNQEFWIDGNNGAANFQQTYLYAKRYNDNQKWEEINQGGGFYSYKKKGTNFALDGGNGGANGNPVYLYQYNPNNQNQHWRKISTGNGHFVLQKRNASGYAIDGGNGAQNNQKLKLWAINLQNVNQQWQFNTVYGSREASGNNATTVTKEEIDATELVLYPIPVKNTLQIRNLPEHSKGIVIYNIAGQALLNYKLDPNTKTFDVKVNDLISGSYILEIITKNKTFTRKFVK